jgi:hypothetical protein
MGFEQVGSTKKTGPPDFAERCAVLEPDITTLDPGLLQLLRIAQ